MNKLQESISVLDTLFAAFNAEIKNKAILTENEIVVLFKDGSVARIKTKNVA